MAGGYLLDTDVLVDHLRGRRKAAEFLQRLEGELLVSAITVAELYSGIRGQEEMDALEEFLLAFQIVPVDEEVAKGGGLLRRQYGSSHGTGLADALIAACAERRDARLVTLNAKHFPMLEGVTVPYKKA
ncbi:MAG: type II toxin-antitoxin system VapC family toxin [Acidobacteria bacterium]|nr:type II toxin-antitoxin system VapC family toxin [Acidobacteriota bacterium]